MEYSTIIWIIWSISAASFVSVAMMTGIFAFASLGAPGISIMERDHYNKYFRVLFLGLPLFQLSTIIFALYALKHWQPFATYLIIFLPYLLIPCIVMVGQGRGNAVSAEAKKLRKAFYESPRLSELENRALTLQFHSDAGNLWQHTLQQMEQNGFKRCESLDKKVGLRDVTPFHYHWNELPLEQTLSLQVYTRGNDTIYVGNATESGSFLLAATTSAGEYLRSAFDSIPWPKFDKAALQKIWRNNMLSEVSQFLQFWHPEKGSSCREVFVEIEQALMQGCNARATLLHRQTKEEGFWNSVPYIPHDTGEVEDIEFWHYEHAVSYKMNNLQSTCFFSYGSSIPLLATAGSLRFLCPSDAGFLKTETPEEIRLMAQKQYRYRVSPPPSNLREHIREVKKAREDAKK